MDRAIERAPVIKSEGDVPDHPGLSLPEDALPYVRCVLTLGVKMQPDLGRENRHTAGGRRRECDLNAKIRAFIDGCVA